MRPVDLQWYVYFDGDDVGARIELHLLRGEVEPAATLSGAVVRAIGDIADQLRTSCGGRVVFAAGDEVLAILPGAPPQITIEDLRRAFFDATGLTISCGIGPDAKAAAQELRLAKLQGKDRSQWSSVP